MGDFLLAVLLCIFTAIGGYVMGQEDQEIALGKDCSKAGEMQIGATYYSCEPVGSLVEGKRIAFKQAYQEPL